MLKWFNIKNWFNIFSQCPWFDTLCCTGSFNVNLKTKIIFSRWGEFQWCYFGLRTPLAYTCKDIILNLISCSIYTTYFRGTAILFYEGYKRLCVRIILQVSIRLICGGKIKDRWRSIMDNYSVTLIISATIFGEDAEHGDTKMLWWGMGRSSLVVCVCRQSEYPCTW